MGGGQPRQGRFGFFLWCWWMKWGENWIFLQKRDKKRDIIIDPKNHVHTFFLARYLLLYSYRLFTGAIYNGFALQTNVVRTHLANSSNAWEHFPNVCELHWFVECETVIIAPFYFFIHVDNSLFQNILVLRTLLIQPIRHQQWDFKKKWQQKFYKLFFFNFNV